ncbi:putative late blight resistance protein homolog R1B-16 [Salvia miltiorrhiza]|uniref:putative late blight resistance protein homolog R1B-16 n=1 Tax=Salvia miltiorrhiza TaxID=226208 RepID=UPI0025AC9D9D|nr:putative late blight resistance protein homolog R1B-16 [Salvia miltiorrhiza]
MDKLTSNRLDLQIIPIVGMGGSGKTTLARNIYQERLIREHFDVCGWATISQEYCIPEILAQVLSQLNEQVGQHLSEGALGEMLHKHLDRVRNYFPDNKNGSRIVVTTRLSNLASKLPNSDSLNMKLLDEADSWELLSKTVFGEQGWLLELEEVGKRIGKSCKRLPLSIIVVGGLLAKSKHTREFWESTKENLNSIVNLEDDERCLKLLHMSYKQLPVHLKPCFLYMGVFAEDEVIHISKLIKLWVAEGFLKAVSGKSLEEIAKEYLKDLIGRNLILIHELGSINGSIKKCKIHDLLRDLCLREAQKERFYALTPQGMQGNAAQRRIVISSTLSKNEAINALSSMPVLARSLIWNLDEDQVLPPLMSRVLRILYSTQVRFLGDIEFIVNMQKLVNSRFLTFSAYVRWYQLPRSIWRFWNLQTLIVERLDGFTAPTDIWYMPHIRHIQFKLLNLPDPPNSQDGIVLGNLQTLRTVKNFKCSKQVAKRIPNIRKLKIYYETVDDSYCLSNLDSLDKLESFTCGFFQGINPSRPDSVQSLFNFPHSLKKLTLEDHESEYYWEDILDKIGALPLLQKLKLYGGRFKEGKWETSEGQFRSLKFLSVCYMKGLQVWISESSHFPCLHHLYLYYLDNLKEIPIDFAQVSTLGVIDVQWCSDSAVVSAKRILEEQEELYGEEAALQVRVS